VLVLGGLVLGVYLFVLSQISVGTGDMAARRQRAEAFGWPLRLNDRVNVLLMGTDVTLDNRRRVLNVARADTLALITFDPERGQIAVLSIPRDTRAQIPGYGETKINAAYAYGGPRLTVRTVEQLLGVRVHFYIKLGPESFAKIIDAIGGVEVDVEKDMKYTDSWAGYRIDLKKGRQRLNGEQATGYIRFRHDELGDIGRVERQHKLLSALVRQLREPSTVVAAPRLLRVVAENTQTSLTPSEMMTLGYFALRIKDAPLRMHTLPGSFAPNYWEPVTPKVQALVADLFYGVTLEELAETPIEVLNASGIPGLGRKVADRVTTLGFRTVRVGTAAASVEVTTIIDRTGRPGVARMLAAAIGKVTIRQEPASAGAPITILVARDAARVVSAPVPGRPRL
jgi:LCP family protein required for cell wall assembly